MAAPLCRALTLLATLLLAPAALAEEAAPLELGPVKDKLKVLHDGKGHYFVVEPAVSSEHLYFGDGKTLHKQRIRGGSANGQEQTFEANFWEPRVPAPYQATFATAPGKGTLTCFERTTPFTELPQAEATALLGAAKFLPAPFQRMAYALARDRDGNYYYVDRAREPENNRNFRVFAGPRGKLVPLKLKNVVSDSQGDIFAAKNGQLRLVLDRQEASWVAGNSKPLKLTLVPVEDNLALVYSELGVYKEGLGTPCDVL